MSNKMIERNGIHVYPVDSFSEGLNKCPNVFIINSDISSGNGIHYYVVYVYEINKVYIIDSLGKQQHSGRPYDDIMMQSLNGFDVRWFPYKFQMNKSVHCGWFSIFTAKLVERLNYPPVNVVEQRLIKLFGKTADNADEQVLVNAFGVQV
jgi:hypothetical protein